MIERESLMPEPTSRNEKLAFLAILAAATGAAGVEPRRAELHEG